MGAGLMGYSLPLGFQASGGVGGLARRVGAS